VTGTSDVAAASAAASQTVNVSHKWSIIGETKIRNV
jgi:hypothetical protein